ncbi:MAG: helix-turn-helix domain-containing protein [Bacteroidales bacterium]|nr:helix-turn-helix domain-containing protein [Bacteroidales bacterium]
MNKRLQQFITAENLSQSQFADSIGVARASVSHILAGRNKPGFDFIENMARQYPSLNLEWLITGKGKMYRTTADSASEKPAHSGRKEAENGAQFDLFSAGENPEISVGTLPENPDDSPFPGAENRPVFPVSSLPAETVSSGMKTTEKRSYQPRRGRSITKIVVFYDDNTFQELK